MSRQAPQFRPRRGAPDGRRKWTMLAVSAGVLALGVVALVVTLILTLGGDDDGSATLASGDSTSTTGTEGGADTTTSFQVIDRTCFMVAFLYIATGFPLYR